MQKNFIDEIVKRGESRIDQKREDAKDLLFEQLELQKEINAKLEEVDELTKELEEFEGASEKLKKSELQGNDQREDLYFHQEPQVLY